MQRIDINTTGMRRFEAQTAINPREQLRNEIAALTQEFLASGKKPQRIPYGKQTLAEGIIIANEIEHEKIKNAGKKSQYGEKVKLSEAGRILGVHYTTVRDWIRREKIKLAVAGKKANSILYFRDDIFELKKHLEEYPSEKNPRFVSFEKTAPMLDVSHSYLYDRFTTGKWPLKRRPTFACNRIYFLRSDVLELKEKLKQGLIK